MVMVTPEFGAATSHLTLEPMELIAASLFLSSADCPDTETWRQVTTKIVHSTKVKHFRFFIEDLLQSACCRSFKSE
jgi:hypothetical protein